MPSSQVQTYFRRRADAFDSLYDSQHPWRFRWNWTVRRGLFVRLEVTRAECEALGSPSVLDLGSGSGRNSLEFLRAGSRRVVGIDFSPEMVELARAAAEKKGLASRCEFHQGDIFQFPLDEKFDLVTALGVFDYIDDPAALLQRMRSLAVHTLTASFPGWTPLRAPLRKLRYRLRGCPVYFYRRAEIVRLCEQVGLKNYELVRPRSRDGYILIGRV